MPARRRYTDEDRAATLAPLDAIVPRLAEVCRRWRPSWAGLEAVGFQAGLVNEARRRPGGTRPGRDAGRPPRHPAAWYNDTGPVWRDVGVS